MTIEFKDQVAIVTGAGNGLGRQYALELGLRGAKVLVNDLGGARDGTGVSAKAAQSVADEITSAGGTAIANGANVADFEQVTQMVEEAKAAFGRVDILLNNAGILRDKSFAKMTVEDFRAVIDVHLMGSFHCTKAVWETMRGQGYGRIVMTTSPSGLYGNFGQTNYSAAKLGLVGFMNTLTQEGAKYDIKCNTVSPVAATRMTEDLVPAEVLKLLMPEAVVPATLFLASNDAPSNIILSAGGGVYARARIFQTQGVFLAPEARTPEQVAEQFEHISATEGQTAYTKGAEQDVHFLKLAAEGLGLST